LLNSLCFWQDSKQFFSAVFFASLLSCCLDLFSRHRMGIIGGTHE
jgi:hypothetical protein